MSFQAVAIDGGLDLVTPPVSVPAGRIVWCKNYEVGVFQGLRRIDGYERYDGGKSPSYYVVTVIRIRRTELAGDYTANFIVGASVTLTQDDGVTTTSGTVVSSATTYSIPNNRTMFDFDVILTDQNPYNILRTVKATDNGTAFVTLDPTVSYDTAPTITTDLANRATYYSLIRSTVQAIPGQGHILGLFWFKDQLYGIRDYTTLVLVGATVEPEPHDILWQGASFAAAVWKADVVKVVIVSGSWGLGNAEANVAVCKESGGQAAAAYNIRKYSDGSDVLAAGVLFVGSTVPAQAAGLYLAAGGRGTNPNLDTSWQHRGLGYYLNYKNCSVEILSRNIFQTADAPTPIATAWKTCNTTVSSGNWSVIGATAGDVAEAVESDDGDTSYANVNFTAVTSTQNVFWIDDLGFAEADIPDGSYITGIEVQVKRGVNKAAGATATVVDLYAGLTGLNNDTGQGFADNATAWPTTNSPAATTYTTATYGGQNSLLGYSNVTPDKVQDSDFGFRFAAKCSAYAGAGGVNARVSYIRIRIWYVPPQNKLYFWNGTRALTGSVVENYLDSGLVTGGTAAGTLYLTDVAAGVRIQAGEQIRSYPATAGVTPDGGASDGSTLLATTATRAERNVMDWGDLLAATKPDGAPASKYQYVVANFYARAGYEAVYGVSGAGPAYFYDGKAFARIRTGLTISDEKPRHVAYHQNRLWLGYYSGHVTYSDAGDPFTYTGGNAADIGVGKPVVGLAPLTGDALGVPTSKSFEAIYGQVSAGPYAQTITPTVGVIEYTFQQGLTFTYTSFLGLQVLESTNAYGDYIPSRHSELVWPWLRDRVQNSTLFESGNKGVINAAFVRNKKQYRLPFADGYQLTATYLREGELPQYTIQLYLHANGDPLTWDVLTVGIQTGGRDRIFGATNDFSGYVYEIDRGNSFDGRAIDAYFTMVPNHMESPWATKEFQSVQVYGMASDYATFTMSRASDYDVATNAVAFAETFGDPALTPTGDTRPFSSYQTGNIEGQAINLRFDSSSNSQFPHIIQAVAYEVKPLSSRNT